MSPYPLDTVAVGIVIVGLKTLLAVAGGLGLLALAARRSPPVGAGSMRPEAR